jgi:formyltetrahydrofolate deformylase
VISQATLLLSCPDRKGLVATMANLLYEVGANILHADQHLDGEARMFFQRIQFDLEGITVDRADLASRIQDRCVDLGMRHRLEFGDRVKRTAILVSRQDHCLYDLLLRHRAGELRTEIACVVSNHEAAGEAAAAFGLPFHHLPVTKETKAEQEQTLLGICRDASVDLLILARYMQVLTGGFLAALDRPVINIHHSFLPAFVGERPYHRAYERGVKLIGATAHYVTEDLDEGPIIEQDVVRVSHADQVPDLVRKGRDLEKLVLARAVRYHLEDRVLVYGNKTVVFD